jgi:hypothetical protein
MVIVCNKCIPDDNWQYGADVCYVGKWYPIGSYRTMQHDILGKKINEYLDKHAHDEDIPEPYNVNNPDHTATLAQNENPVRLTYETWARDMPAIKKWSMEADTSGNDLLVTNPETTTKANSNEKLKSIRREKR